jgi:hypothetical protein
MRIPARHLLVAALRLIGCGHRPTATTHQQIVQALDHQKATDRLLAMKGSV